MNGKILGIVAVIIVIIGGWYLLKSAPVPTENTTETPTDNNNVTVTYTDQGFSPQSVTVPLGATVTFVNKTSGSMWVTSDPHPTHEWYDGTTETQHCVAGYSSAAPFDECSAGSTFTFTFTKAGKWGYHNHSSSANRGTVIVTE